MPTSEVHEATRVSISHVQFSAERDRIASMEQRLQLARGTPTCGVASWTDMSAPKSPCAPMLREALHDENAAASMANLDRDGRQALIFLKQRCELLEYKLVKVTGQAVMSLESQARPYKDAGVQTPSGVAAFCPSHCRHNVMVNLLAEYLHMQKLRECIRPSFTHWRRSCALARIAMKGWTRVWHQRIQSYVCHWRAVASRRVHMRQVLLHHRSKRFRLALQEWHHQVNCRKTSHNKAEKLRHNHVSRLCQRALNAFLLLVLRKEQQVVQIGQFSERQAYRSLITAWSEWRHVMRMSSESLKTVIHRHLRRILGVWHRHVRAL
eukprot:jgi/Ulvmu1/1704/UM116_0017.1